MFPTGVLEPPFGRLGRSPVWPGSKSGDLIPNCSKEPKGVGGKGGSQKGGGVGGNGASPSCVFVPPDADFADILVV